MTTRLISPPGAEPVTVSEAKANLRVTHTDDDDLITRIIGEARDFIERRIQKKLMSQTWELVLDNFGTGTEIKLPVVPVQSITSVKYDDSAGVEQTVTPEDYYLDNANVDEAWLFPVAAWPADLLAAVNTVRIRYVAGYASSDLIPRSVRAAVFLKIEELYEGTDRTRAINDLLTNHLTMVA